MMKIIILSVAAAVSYLLGGVNGAISSRGYPRLRQ